MFSENIDNDDYLHCTDPLEVRIGQFDGNDTLEPPENSTLANNSARSVRTRVAAFELNQAKQTADICKDALIQDFKLIHKDQDKNINIECSSGFYAQVAKPTLCSLSQDFIPPILGFSIFCSNITKNIDARGHEYSLTMFFKITQNNDNSTKVTIHAHHSTRLVQVQGGAAMPDKSTSALWFVKNVLYGKFQVLAGAKSLSISRLNEAITSLAGSSPNPQKSKCGSCDIIFDSRSKPVYCVPCVMWFHKTNCHRAHRCKTGPVLPPLIPGPSTSRDGQAPGDRDVSPLLPARQVPALPASTASSTPVTTASALVSLSRASSMETTLISSTTTTFAPTPLNPNAHNFLPQPPSNARKPRQTQNASSFTPEKAEIESLKIELGYARTKIVDLQTKTKDQEHTIDVYSQKLKLLEDSRLSSLHSKYFSPTSSNLGPSSDNSSDCPCQIRAQISRNATNLMNMESLLTLELQNISKRLDDIKVQGGTATSPWSSSATSPQSSSAASSLSSSATAPQSSSAASARSSSAASAQSSLATFENSSSATSPQSTSTDSHQFSAATTPQSSSAMPTASPGPRQESDSPPTVSAIADDDMAPVSQPTEASNILVTDLQEVPADETSMSIESEFDFSESFNFPENSPRISLN